MTTDTDTPALNGAAATQLDVTATSTRTRPQPTPRAVPSNVTSPRTRDARAGATIQRSLIPLVAQAVERRYPGYDMSQVVAVSQLIITGHKLWAAAGRPRSLADLVPDELLDDENTATMNVRINQDARQACEDVVARCYRGRSGTGHLANAANDLLRVGLHANADQPPAPAPFEIPTAGEWQAHGDA